MESFLSDYLAIFQNLTVPGFLYLIGILILIESYTEFSVFKYIQKNKELILISGALIIVFSFLIGLTVFLTEQEIKSLLIRQLDNVYPKQGVDEEGYLNMYGVLIMYRHLILSSTFIVFSYGIYQNRQNKKLKNYAFGWIIYTILIILMILSYFKIKGILNDKSCGRPISEICVILIFASAYMISLLMHVFRKK